LQEANWPDGYFDVVMLMHVLEHLDDPLSSLWLIHRLLKPSGLVVIQVPNMTLKLKRLELIRFIGLRLSSAGFDTPYHINFFVPRTLEKLVAKAGFKPIKAANGYPVRYFSRPMTDLRFQLQYYVAQLINSLSGGALLLAAGVDIYAQRL
jgi:SAM-dependent methyltransferase